jgi:hypothetical protein
MSSREFIRLTESSRACENAYKARSARGFPSEASIEARVGPKESIGTKTRTTTFDSNPEHQFKGRTTTKRKRSSNDLA